MVQAHRLASERMREAGERSKEWYDSKWMEHTDLVMDLVWLLTPKVPKGKQRS